MNDKNQNIDNLFEEALGNLTVEPSEGAWSEVAGGLDTILRSNRTKYYRWISLSVAAVAIIVYIFFFRSCNVGASSGSYIMKNRLFVFDKSSKIKRVINKSEDEIKVFGNNYSQSNTYSIRQISNTKPTPRMVSSPAVKEITRAEINNLVNLEIELPDNPDFANKSENKQSTSDIKDISISVEKEKQIQSSPELSLSPDLKTALDTLSGNDDEIIAAPVVVSPLPGPQIATSLELEFGIGPMRINNKIPQEIIYDNPLLDSKTDRYFSSAEGFVQLKYKISDFYGKTGFRFSEFGENNIFTISTEMHDTSGGYQSWNLSRYWTYDTIGYYDDPNTPGQVYPVLSPTYHIDTLGAQWNSRDVLYYDKSLVAHKNRYRYIEIPFIVGYQKNFNRMGVFIDAGLGMGFMLNTTGAFVEDGFLQSMNKSSNPYKRFNINYMINLGTNYALNNQWNLFIQASYKSNLTSIYKPQFDMGVKYKSLGVQFGMSYIIK